MLLSLRGLATPPGQGIRDHTDSGESEAVRLAVTTRNCLALLGSTTEATTWFSLWLNLLWYRLSPNFSLLN